MNKFETILFRKESNLALVTLNQPESLNSFSVQMRDDLKEIMLAIQQDDEVYVVIINGAGENAFCAGADLREFLTAPPPIKAREIRNDIDLWGLLTVIEQPIIAALHGYVLGSGIEISLFCDIRIASDNTKFGLPETSLGIIPAAGGTQTTPRIIGIPRALELMLTNHWLDVDQACRYNLVNRVVPRKDLMPTALFLARKLAGYDQVAVRAAKKVIKQGFDLTLVEGLEMEKKMSLLIHRATNGNIH